MVESGQQGLFFISLVSIFFFGAISQTDLNEMYLKQQFSWNPSRMHANSPAEFWNSVIKLCQVQVPPSSLVLRMAWFIRNLLRRLARACPLKHDRRKFITSDKCGRVGAFCCSTLPERRRSSRRWRSVGMHSYCILGEWHTTEQLGKRQTQHHFSLIIACHIWYGTHCCRYVLSFSALGFIPTGLPLQLLLLMLLETCLIQQHVVFILRGWLGRTCNC